MGTLARTFPPERRNSVMGAWGAANGIGQAIGPPVGGFIADAFGWRAIFGALIPVTIGVLVLTLRVVPRDSGQHARIDWVGAGSLTVGVALLMTAVDRRAAARRARRGCPAVGAVARPGRAWSGSCVSRAAPGGRRSSTRGCSSRSAGCAAPRACSCSSARLAAVLVGVPLYLTGVADLSVSATGLLIFSLPLVWAVLAPLVGLLADRVGPRPVLRTGLGVLVVGRRRAGGRPRQRGAAPAADPRAAGRGRRRRRPRADARPDRGHPLARRAARRRPRAVQHDAVRGRRGGHRRGRRGLARRPAPGCSAAARRSPSAVSCSASSAARWPTAPSAVASQSGLTTRSTSAVVFDSRSRVCASHTANWFSACRRSMPSSREARSSL